MSPEPRFFKLSVAKILKSIDPFSIADTWLLIDMGLPSHGLLSGQKAFEFPQLNISRKDRTR